MSKALLSLFVALALAVPMLPTRVTLTEGAAAVRVTLQCYSNPEKTTIRNNGTTSVTVRKVGSTYQPYSYEPFVVSKRLAAGQSIRYQTGRAATRNVLSRNYIYNDNGRDGAKIVTSVGTFTRKC